MSETINEAESYIVFELAGTTYAVGSRHVKQMEMVESITPVPNAPPFVEGVAFSRGQVIPALNLRVRFGFERRPHDLRSRLIVVESGGRTVGLIVDTAREFVLIPKGAIQPTPETVTGLSGKYLDGIATVGERVFMVLNVEEALNAHTMSALASVA